MELEMVIFAGIVLKKSRKKSIYNDNEINKNLLIIFCHFPYI